VIGYFIEQILSAYGLLANLEEGLNKSNIVLVADTIMFSWLVFVTCNTAQRATDEVRNFLNSTIL
jgi:membrane-bound acyltransferase YfiQ involved in biofilm formation